MINWRKIIVEKLLEIFNEPVAGIVAGILIGVRSTIPENILNNFQITGLTHVLAISGFNITLIINLVTILLANLPRVRRFYLCLVLIVLFAVLTGLSSSVVRAALMGLMILLVKTMGRKSNVMTVIMLSGFLMVLISPRILSFDVSFQLSFLATLSLIRFSDHFEKIGLSWPKMVREGVLVTLTAQVLTLPISFYNFGKISLIAPLANMLTLPLVPIIMAGGFATFLFSLPSLILAKYLGGLTWLITMLMIKIVEILAKIPFAAVIIGKGSVPLVLIYYLLVFRFFHKSKPEPDLILHHVPPDQSISSQEF